MSKATAITIYRTLLKWTKKTPGNEVPFDVPLTDVERFLFPLPDGNKIYEESAPMNATGKLGFSDGQGVQKLVRLCFKASKDLTPDSDEANQAFDRGFDALRRINKDYTGVLQELQTWSSMRQEEKGLIKHPIGLVARHKKFGYRGVVFGWDQKCEKDHEWQQEMGIDKLPNGFDQPFYCLLPDESDCRRLFGGRRDNKYVAQDNLEPITGEEARVSHARLNGFFQGFNVSRQQYLPNRLMRYLYHEDFDEKDEIEPIPS